MSSSGSYFTNPAFVKPISAGIIAGLLDKFLLGNSNTPMTNVYFGLSVAGGTFAGTLIEPYVPAILPDTTFYNGATVSGRVAEIAFGAGASYLTNRFLLKNDLQPQQLWKKLGVIAISQFSAEYISDYMNSAPLSYLM